MSKKAKYQIQTAVNGDHYFLLIAPNGKVIATSEMYKSRQSCLKGIKSCQKNGSTEIVRIAP